MARINKKNNSQGENLLPEVTRLWCVCVSQLPYLSHDYMCLYACIHICVCTCCCVPVCVHTCLCCMLGGRTGEGVYCVLCLWISCRPGYAVWLCMSACMPVHPCLSVSDICLHLFLILYIYTYLVLKFHDFYSHVSPSLHFSHSLLWSHPESCHWWENPQNPMFQALTCPPLSSSITFWLSPHLSPTSLGPSAFPGSSSCSA